MRYQFQIDGRPAGPIRKQWEDAAWDAVSAGYASWVMQGIALDEQASIERINDGNHG